jgi:hypothetical protein
LGKKPENCDAVQTELQQRPKVQLVCPPQDQEVWIRQFNKAMYPKKPKKPKNPQNIVIVLNEFFKKNAELLAFLNQLECSSDVAGGVKNTVQGDTKNGVQGLKKASAVVLKNGDKKKCRGKEKFLRCGGGRQEYGTRRYKKRFARFKIAIYSRLFY